MRLAVALVLVVTSACRIDDHLVACGDLACPVGLVCTVGGCATQEAATACAERADGERCTSAAVADGTCTGGACYAVGCGNGVLDYGEKCDDGNNVYLDGCSADCRSDETCGNAIPDPLSLEQCDSGVRGLSSDGCTSRCTNEIEIWRAREPYPPSARGGHALAYDAARGVVVLFGGFDGTWGNETWEWNGALWRRLRPPTSPPGRNNHAMAYDGARQRVVLYGGNGAFLIRLHDTWEWDGVNWVERIPATSPGDLYMHSMAFDPTRNVTVLFGGRRVDNSYSNDLWEWNGLDWTRVPQAGAWPAGRMDAAFAFDPDLGGLLVFGGVGLSGANSVALQDTWTWGNGQWTLQAPATKPSVRYNGAVASDASRLVLTGGSTLAAGSELGDTWEWTGTNWVALAAAPAQRTGHAMAFDAARGAFVAYGGSSSGTTYGDTWLFTNTWTTPSIKVMPSPRTDHALAYDPLRGRVVLFGGRNGGARLGDTWEWDGANWLPMAVTGPSPRHSHMLAFHPRFGVLLFGGNAAGPTLRNDLWSWNGVTWTQLVVGGVVPPPRALHGLAYDARRDQLVVFGGTAPDLGDTWVWNGTVWDEVTPLTGPSARIGPSMSYDPVRERVVMVGGNANSTPLADVWEWDGSSWGERGSIAPLLPRGSAAATYDPIRQVTSLVGGVSYFLGRLDETLEWNGQVIDLRAVPATAGPRSGAGLAYHAIEHALVTFGGDAGGNPFDDTWVRVYESYDHPAERCAIETEDSDGDGLAGCADPDCYGRCAPLCLPGATCPSDAPRCGDGTCSPVEDHLICDVDC